MNKQEIIKLCDLIFQEVPNFIERKTIGICNEVYEVGWNNERYILRMNAEKKYIYGTYKFLPIFKELNIETPEIIADDYSRERFAFCYQFLNKIKGKDLGLVIHLMSENELKTIALEVSNIFDKFNSLPFKNTFGSMTGLDEENYGSLFEIMKHKRKLILDRNEKTKVLDSQTIDILNSLISEFQNYFIQAKSKLYYDDICSKNIMIHNGKFSGLVDLDFLTKGDFLDVIGTIMASWYGEKYGEVYTNELISLQRLNLNQQRIVKMYAIINLILWTSEEGIKFNSNSSGVINFKNVKIKKLKVLSLFNELNKNK